MEKGHNAGGDEKLRISKTFLGLIYISGIYICYLVYGILQERIMRTPFGEDKEKFTFTLFLLFCQCLASALSSLYGASKTPNQTPIYKYGIFATTYLAAMYFSNVALAYIDYPTQVLGKSCKPIPVMIISTLMGRRYPWYKWLLVLMIVGGISMFFFKPSDGGQGNSTIGIVCLLLSLACDGFTGPFQDRVFKMYKPSTNHMIVYSNLFAVGYCLFGLVLTPEGYEAITFCQRHPEIINDIILFSVCGAAGQQFIYLTIQTFNSLVCSIATTTRKFFTILISVLWFGNALLPHQWVGVSLVFIGLGIDSFGSHLDEFVNKLLGKPTPAKGEKFDKPV